MSAAAAEAADAPPAKGSKKKLIIILAAVLLVLLIGGGVGAFMLMTKNAAAAEGEDGAADGGGHHAEATHEEEPKYKKPDHASPPTYITLDPFIVNLADRDSDRFAQVGIVLELDDPHVEGDIKAYMPAIRNNILLLLGHKTAESLMAPGGKEELADEILRETVRPLGIEMDDDSEDEDTSKKKRKKRRAPQYVPVRSVQFSSFIIQ